MNAILLLLAILGEPDARVTVVEHRPLTPERAVEVLTNRPFRDDELRDEPSVKDAGLVYEPSTYLGHARYVPGARYAVLRYRCGGYRYGCNRR